MPYRCHQSNNCFTNANVEEIIGVNETGDLEQIVSQDDFDDAIDTVNKSVNRFSKWDEKRSDVARRF